MSLVLPDFTKEDPATFIANKYKLNLERDILPFTPEDQHFSFGETKLWELEDVSLSIYKMPNGFFEITEVLAEL